MKLVVAPLTRPVAWGPVPGNIDVITIDRMRHMKDRAIVCNIGHFDSEIQIAALRNYRWEEVKPQVDEVVFPDGKRLTLDLTDDEKLDPPPVVTTEPPPARRSPPHGLLAKKRRAGDRQLKGRAIVMDAVNTIRFVRRREARRLA